MKGNIFLQLTRKDQAVALLELLLKKDNRSYISFYNALVKEKYVDLANLLFGNLPCISPAAHSNSFDGCTPYGEEVGRARGCVCVCVCARWSIKVLGHSEWTRRLMRSNIQEGGTFGC